MSATNIRLVLMCDFGSVVEASHLLLDPSKSVLHTALSGIIPRDDRDSPSLAPLRTCRLAARRAAVAQPGTAGTVGKAARAESLRAERAAVPVHESQPDSEALRVTYPNWWWLFFQPEIQRSSGHIGL